MGSDPLLTLLRAVLDLVLRTIPVEDIRDELDQAGMRRQKALKDAADAMKFGAGP